MLAERRADVRHLSDKHYIWVRLSVYDSRIDPLGIEETEVRAPSAGVIIGRSNLPLVYAGDALFHIADMHEEAVFEVESFHEQLMPSDYQPGEDDPSSAPIAI